MPGAMLQVNTCDVSVGLCPGDESVWEEGCLGPTLVLLLGDVSSPQEQGHRPRCDMRILCGDTMTS